MEISIEYLSFNTSLEWGSKASWSCLSTSTTSLEEKDSHFLLFHIKPFYPASRLQKATLHGWLEKMTLTKSNFTSKDVLNKTEDVKSKGHLHLFYYVVENYLTLEKAWSWTLTTWIYYFKMVSICVMFTIVRLLGTNRSNWCCKWLTSCQSLSLLFATISFRYCDYWPLWPNS